MSERKWIGFDLGGTKMLCAVFDEKMRDLGRERKKTKGFLGPDAGIERIIKCIYEAVENSGVPLSEIAGIGIGCPGPIQPKKGILLEAPNLGWKNVAVAERLNKEFKKPVMVINDVDAGVYGEYLFGAGQGAESLLGVFPGTGIGGGFVQNGVIFQGAKISCMEIGHIPTVPDGPIASAGLPGSLEAVASRLAMSALIAQASYRGQAPTIAESAGTDLANIRSGLLAEALKKEEPMVVEIMSRAVTQLGRSIAGFVHMLAPERIVLGGGLVEAMPDFFSKKIKEGMKQWLLPAYRDASEVVVAKLGDDAGIRGAAAWVRKNIESEPGTSN
ncbi:ROK family protein [Rubinisphaera margarita]|uniref:ROK family protein n=1 Tax=Rubinisphaera margarita TaxID=2909586 RepID=UPI001EE97E52|nr:ROK family protein [Rubinisphaera margarita]MCG6154278.1 ROK family protein [Rubinisphaera margarita]